MIQSLRTSILYGSVLLLSACAVQPDIPEIKYDNLDFDAAVVESEPLKPIKVVEVPKPLPLPGQLKPAPGKTVAKKLDKHSQKPA